METFLHPLEKHRKAFMKTCIEQNINSIISESLFNQISNEAELDEALQSLSRKDSSATEPATSRRSSYIPPRKQSLCIESSSNFMDRSREKPAQLKLEKEIEEAKEKADELRRIQSFRQLSAAEIEELKNAELIEYESKKKLKRTKDAAARAKRYRIRKANENCGNNNNNNIHFSLETHFEESLNSNSPEDLRSSSSTSFNESFPPFLNPPTTQSSSSLSPSRKRPYSPSPTTTTSATTFQTNNFVCPKCDCHFPNLGQFISHMRTQHLQTSAAESELFFCQICNISFPSASNRLSHMIKHFIGNSSTISCQKCLKQFENSTNFRQHFLSCHSETLHRCNICYQIFTQNYAFQDHMNLHMISEIRYTCVACPSLIFESFENFESHIQLFHDKNETNGISSKSKQNGISNPQPSAPAPAPGRSTTKPLKCIVCDKECANELLLDEHRLFNHCKVPKSDRCTVCRQILTGITDFTTHMHLHSDSGLNNNNDNMDCIVCRQKIRNDIQLKMHAEYHLDIPFDETSATFSPIDSSSSTTKCSICNYWISTNELAKHYLQHASSSTSESHETNEMIKSEIFDPSASTPQSPLTLRVPLICHCGQQFDDENELTIHALEHLNETLPGFTNSNEQQPQSFDCPRCPKRFASLSALQGHSHVHMTQKIFKCSKCSHTFNSAFRLQQHRFKHTSKNDLKCRICDKKFLLNEELQSHMLIHESSLTNFVGTNNPLIPSSKSSNEPLEV
uniref:C2H2-type domain-containing protein n=1 Tax=Panagrolaimus sp. PS1159 TaxID=55785 RepID=A0AC35F7S5_9BILA